MEYYQYEKIDYGTRIVQSSFFNGKAVRKEETVSKSIKIEEGDDAIEISNQEVVKLVNSGARKDVSVKYGIDVKGNIVMITILYTKTIFSKYDNHKENT